MTHRHEDAKFCINFTLFLCAVVPFAADFLGAAEQQQELINFE